MKSLNKVQVIGYVGKDAEVRYTPGGTAVAEFSVATTEKWKDKQTGEAKERTEWFTITSWDKLAELVGEYVKKGIPVFVEGSLKTDKYEKDGVTHYRTKVTAQNIIFLKDADKGAAPAKPAAPAAPAAAEPDPFGDDIPF
jgi:single-strand DNA-binding protein